MCSKSPTKEADGKAEDAEVQLEASKLGDDALLAEWRQAEADLNDIDSVIGELREEIRRFEVRREVIARKKEALRARFTLHSAAGLATPDGSTTASEASPSVEPLVFNLDDANPILNDRPPSIEDWEHGLEILATAGATRDRAANLRAHWMMSSSREGR
eukprot:TRINITY_DN60199_c0_g1_i1.p2 TRINITY_DN60199_c0_g1~~TRINITY_DN60199_c0_g1_i1.p2  ORF type:complete len:159 (+),score=35.71 TRINITY_DN60199_c0_g1_i1:48-524(+)